MGDEPPVLILICSERPPGGLDAGRMAGASVYPAIQNLMLAARAKGIGSTMTTLHKAREQDIKKILGVPEHVETIALIPLGYPQGHWGRPKRKPAHEVTFWNHWGEKHLHL